ncbi:MAG: hypothetical protein ACKVQA_17085 [Burkholderiales bacterium]
MEPETKITEKFSLPSGKDMQAAALPHAGHEAAGSLFAAYENSQSPAERARIAAQICMDLRVYAQVEDEIFYPAVIRALQRKR